MINESFSPESPDSPLKSIGLFIWDLAKVFVVAFVVVWLVLRPFVAEPFIVSGSSMVPNFHDKEYLIVQKLSYRTGDAQRGDVIVFKYPKDPSQYFIKRVIGLPGEEVHIAEGRVRIVNAQNPQGFVLDEPYINNQPITSSRLEVSVLGEGEYFVLGDNRLQSSDSRVWGALPEEDIVGKVWLRVLPVAKFGTVEHARYTEE